jgi:hypothetical protein
MSLCQQAVRNVYKLGLQRGYAMQKLEAMADMPIAAHS